VGRFHGFGPMLRFSFSFLYSFIFCFSFLFLNSNFKFKSLWQICTQIKYEI
jgi:hypothetical protein